MFTNGFIYIMYNPGYQEDLLKIGKTKRSSKIRGQELSRPTGVPGNFIVAQEWLVDYCDLVERVIHEEFNQYRYNRNREFFNIPLINAINKINEIVNRYRSSDMYTYENKWVHGKANFNFDALPDFIYLQKGILPVRCSLDIFKGSEVALFYLDQTNFIYDLAKLNPFNLFMSSGILQTQYGLVSFHVFSISNPKNLREPLLTVDVYLNPFDPNQLLLWRDLSRQSYWHLFMIDGQKNQVDFREFENHFRLGEHLDLVDKVFSLVEPHTYSFDLARNEVLQRYTPKDLWEL